MSEEQLGWHSSSESAYSFPIEQGRLLAIKFPRFSSGHRGPKDPSLLRGSLLQKKYDKGRGHEATVHYIDT